MSDGVKIVTIGGGSSYTPELMEGFINRYHELPIRELWLTDIESGEEKLDIIFALCQRMIEKSGHPIRLYKTLDRREALHGADFVTTQFRVGQLCARELDETIPLSHGVLGQETNGPGGLFKGLRTIPIIFDIIRDVQELAPDAWLISFTNPAGMVAEAVSQHTDFKKFIGVCNVPVAMKMQAVKALAPHQDDKIEMDLFGLNHLVFMSDLRVNNESRFTELLRQVIENSGENTVKNIIDLGFDPDFIAGLGLIPCPYLRYYYKEKEMLAIEMGEYYKGETRASQVKKIEASLFEKYRDESLNIKPKELDERGGAYYSDAACEIINAIYNDKNSEHYVNICHAGHVQNIPHDWVVEISCRIGKDGAKPVERITTFDEKVLGLIYSIKSFERATIRAALSGNYQDLILAMNLNPLVHSDQDAKKIADELLRAHRQYLPQFD